MKFPKSISEEIIKKNGRSSVSCLQSLSYCLISKRYTFTTDDKFNFSHQKIKTQFERKITKMAKEKYDRSKPTLTIVLSTR